MKFQIKNSTTKTKIREVGVFSFLFVNFIFFFPFIFKEFSPSVYWLFYISAFLFFISTHLFNTNFNVKKIVVKNYTAIFFFLLYTLYLGIIVLSSLYNISETHIPMVTVFYKFINLFFALYMFYFLETGFFSRGLKIFSYLVLLLAVLAVFNTILIALGVTGPVYKLEEIGSKSYGHSSGVRVFYGLTLGWMHFPINGNLVPRLQSFSSEAGNFALALSVVFLDFLDKKKKIKLAAIGIALLLTLSLGNWLGLFILMLLSFIRNYTMFFKYKTYFRIIIILITIILILLYAIPVEVYELLKHYLETKFVEGEHGTSSFDTRANAITFVFDSLERDNSTLLGYGLGARGYLGVTIANGWLDPIIFSGFLGAFFAYCAYGLLMIKAVLTFVNRKKKFIFSGGIIFLGILATQRSFLDSTIWHWWIVVMFLKSINETKVKSI